MNWVILLVVSRCRDVIMSVRFMNMLVSVLLSVYMMLFYMLSRIVVWVWVVFSSLSWWSMLGCVFVILIVRDVLNAVFRKLLMVFLVVCDCRWN